MSKTGVDPYTKVADVLQETPACRRGLQASTELTLELIDAALTRFETMGSVVKFMKGGEEYFRWQSGAEMPSSSTESMPKVSRVESMPAVQTKGRPKGWNLSQALREFISGLSENAEFSIADAYDDLLRRYPNACETYSAGELRSQVGALLSQPQFKGRLIGVARIGKGNSPTIYRKGLNGNGHKISARRDGATSEIATSPQPQIAEAVSSPEVKPDKSPDKIRSLIDNPYVLIIEHLEREKRELDTLLDLLKRRLVGQGGPVL